MIRETLPIGTRIKVANLRGYHRITGVIRMSRGKGFERYYEIEGQGELVDESQISDVIHRPPLMIIIGRTASGKDTLAERHIGPHRRMVKSYTTRPRREGEGDTHQFIDSIEGYNDRWVETKIGEHHYFMTGQDILNKDLILVDPNGFYSLMERLEHEGIERELIVYYLMVGEDVRRERYRRRDGSSAEDFYKRDDAENNQFSVFEKKLRDKDYREKYNIQVLTSEEGPTGFPMFDKLKWVATPYHPSNYGMWMRRKRIGSHLTPMFIIKREDETNE